MIYHIYSAKDALIGFNAPFIMLNEDVAKRDFLDRIEKAPTHLKNDLSLWEIGTFDDETGTIIPKVPKMVTFGKE